VSTLHIAPGHSAGGSLRQAIRDAGRGVEVLFFRDDLSCGPIDSEDIAARVAWWTQFHGDWETEAAPLKAFWERVATTDDRLVVWFGRHSALEQAFFLAWADRLGERPYSIIDVTGLRLPSNRHDSSRALSQPTPAVSIMPPYQLRSLVGSERQVAAREAEEARRQWRRLKAENAPFRVVTPAGLVSAPVDHFDSLLMERVATEWRKVARVIGDTMALNSEPYFQTGDIMLLARVIALIDEGKLLAEGDPWDMHSCRVRLPG
jgi:Protein of unknown function/Domain of unknown function (DUF1835)